MTTRIHRRTRRQGIILLVVLGMIALFTLLAIAFVAMSGQSNTASKQIARVKTKQPDPRLHSDMILRQIVRGSSDLNSAFAYHDLLGDVYGPAPIFGQFRNPGLISTGADGLEVINNTFLKVPLNPLNATGSTTVLSPVDDAYNGRLFTFLGGPLTGHTFRIMQYIGDRPAASPEFSLRNSVLLNISEFAGKTLTARTAHGEISRTLEQWATLSANSFGYDTTQSGVYSNATTYIPYRFIINDAAFNGIGRGVVTDATNPNFGNQADLIPTGMPGISIPSGILHRGSNAGAWINGGTNEGIDVADFRDQFLFYRSTTAATSADMIPSFHRPEVIGYIANLYGSPGSWSAAEAATRVPVLLNLLDLACARPLSYRILGTSGTNTYFTGSNTGAGSNTPQLTLDVSNWNAGEVTKLQNFVGWLMEGPWDVDNDGDGIADSVWKDPNLPLIATVDGKVVKVLVAAMIEDLDGRLNINAHGDLAQMEPLWHRPLTGAFTPPPTPIAAGLAPLSQGVGYGPADISFSHLLGLASYPVGKNPFVLRNGGDTVPGLAGAGVDDDTISNFYQRNMFQHHRHGVGGPKSGLPLARRGGLAYGIDRFGNPAILNNIFGPGVPSETANDPYEFRLRSNSSQDTPFSLVELEKILRRFDASQAQLPTRLQEVLSTGTGGYSNMALINRLITTRSAEIRSPAIGVPSSTTPGDMLEWIRQVYEQKYRAPGDPVLDASDPVNNARLFRNLFASLMPLEFRLNKRYNLNRPFGDGTDNDGDGDIDDPQEIATTVQTESFPGGGSMVGDYTRGFVGAPARLSSRQLAARQLYCLASLLVPRDYRFPGTQGLTQAQAQARRARILAQWAVNVVDFRDEDAVMTRFEYDPSPFGAPGGSPKPPGWNPTFGGATGNVVWGMEFPELALTESLALHNKRSKDTDQDNGSGETMAGMDMTRDQYRIPQGSLFLELYNLRTTATVGEDTLPAAPSSLYVQDAGAMKLDLGKLSPNSPTWGRQPVWRIGISTAETFGSSPNELLQTNPPNPPNPVAPAISGVTYQTSKATAAASGLQYDLSGARPQIDFDRIIWFTDPATLPNQIPNLVDESDPNRAHRVFRVKNVASPYLEGGSYAVIGPRQTTYIGSQTSTASPPTHLPSPQRIELTSTGVTTYKLDGNAESYPVGAGGSAVKPALGLIAAADVPSNPWIANLVVPAQGLYGVGLNISEPISSPTNYYPRPTFRINNADTGNNAGSFQYPGFQALPPDGYKDYTAGNKTLPDIPFDEDPTINTELNPPMQSPKSAVGTYPNFKTAYLQRLADPNFPYDPIENPYITIDWISLDLTVLNGEDSEAASAPVAFQTRYKDGADALHLSGNAGILPLPVPATPPPVVAPTQRQTVGTTMLSYSTSTLVTTPTYSGPAFTGPPSVAPSYFNYQLGYSDSSFTLATSASSLGRLNSGRPLAVGANAPTQFDGFGPPHDSPFPTYDGSPPNAVASLFWFNRPFASPYELMLVPPTGPGEINRLMTHGSASGIYAQVATTPNRPFGQTINMYDTSTTKLDNTTNASGPYTPYWLRGAYNAGTSSDSPLTQADLHMLMELVETPSGYADAGIVMAPNTISTAPPLIQTMLANYLPPNNVLSSYVQPGKININTIPGEEVWKGVELNFLRGTDRAGATGNTIWTQIAESRRGYPAGPIPSNAFFGAVRNANLHPLLPTQFRGAFGSPFTANIAPVLPGPASALQLRNVNPVSASLLRPAPNTSPAIPLIASAYPNVDKQPFAAYQRVMRLPNLVSNQSNVFAVRMTIGYFEFDPATGLGEEYIGFGGEAKRHRSFYIIDRSIPVGYRAGEDLNTENVVLLRRFVE